MPLEWQACQADGALPHFPAGHSWSAHDSLLTYPATRDTGQPHRLQASFCKCSHARQMSCRRMISSSLAIGIPAATCEMAAEAKLRTFSRKLGASVRARSGVDENPNSVGAPDISSTCVAVAVCTKSANVGGGHLVDCDVVFLSGAQCLRRSETLVTYPHRGQVADLSKSHIVSVMMPVSAPLQCLTLEKCFHLEYVLATPQHRLGGRAVEAGLNFVTLGIGWLIWNLIVWTDGRTPGHQVLKMR